MKKFYVRCGGKRAILMASTDLQACLLAFQRFFSQTPQEPITTPDGEGILVGTVFIVSERGFDDHDDDIRYPTSEVMKLQILSNNCVVEDWTTTVDPSFFDAAISDEDVNWKDDDDEDLLRFDP